LLGGSWIQLSTTEHSPATMSKSPRQREINKINLFYFGIAEETRVTYFSKLGVIVLIISLVTTCFVSDPGQVQAIIYPSPIYDRK
jgi:hypothetical protein